jgi:hypothetical protein
MKHIYTHNTNQEKRHIFTSLLSHYSTTVSILNGMILKSDIADSLFLLLLSLLAIDDPVANVVIFNHFISNVTLVVVSVVPGVKISKVA